MATTADAVELALAKVEGAMGARFVGLEGKIDGLIDAVEAAGRARSEDVHRMEIVMADHEGRIRRHGDEIADVRATANNAVTPMKFWGVAATLLGLIIAATSVLVAAINATR